MDVEALKNEAALLEQLTENLMTAMDQVPAVLVRPTFDKVRAAKEDLYEVVAMAMAVENVPHVAKADLETAENRLSSLVGEIRIALEEEPWHDPPKLRSLRQTVDTLLKTAQELRKKHEGLLGQKHSTRMPVDMQYRPIEMPKTGARSFGPRADGPPPEPWAVAAHANTGLKEVDPTSNEPMTVDEALLLLQARRNDSYQGNIVGIVHAAGVQEMVAFPATAPGKLEFTFAPKSAAAYNMHLYSAMM